MDRMEDVISPLSLPHSQDSRRRRELSLKPIPELKLNPIEFHNRSRLPSKVEEKRKHERNRTKLTAAAAATGKGSFGGPSFSLHFTMRVSTPSIRSGSAERLKWMHPFTTHMNFYSFA